MSKSYSLNHYYNDYEGEGKVVEIYRSKSLKKINKAYYLYENKIGYHDKLEIEESDKPKFKSLKEMK